MEPIRRAACGRVGATNHQRIFVGVRGNFASPTAGLHQNHNQTKNFIPEVDCNGEAGNLSGSNSPSARHARSPLHILAISQPLDTISTDALVFKPKHHDGLMQRQQSITQHYGQNVLMNIIRHLFERFLATMDTNASIAAISAIGALLSALYAYQSRKIAKKALSIAQAELDLKKDKLTFYLVEGFKIPIEAGSALTFHASIANQAVSPNTVERLELETTFVREDSSVGSIVLNHDPLLLDTHKHQIIPFQVPLHLGPKNTSAAWCVFEQPSDLFSGKRVDKYTLRLTDMNGRVSEVDSYILREKRDV
jgi:hypothetical protein